MALHAQVSGTSRLILERVPPRSERPLIAFPAPDPRRRPKKERENSEMLWVGGPGDHIPEHLQAPTTPNGAGASAPELRHTHHVFRERFDEEMATDRPSAGVPQVRNRKASLESSAYFACNIPLMAAVPKGLISRVVLIRQTIRSVRAMLSTHRSLLRPQGRTPSPHKRSAGSEAHCAGVDIVVVLRSRGSSSFRLGAVRKTPPDVRWKAEPITRG
jgi:hypothetical protein